MEGRPRRYPVIPRRDVRAADLQEESTKRIGSKLVFGDSHFVGSDEDGGFTANIAASGASNGTQRALASGAIKNVVVLWVALVRLDASVDRSRYG